MIRWAMVAACLSGLLAVALGAFGAHGLAETLGSRADVYETALRYHFVHTLAVMAAALAPVAGAGQRACRFAGGLWLLGMVVFSGSLYGLALTGAGALGAAAPFGGIALMLGWFFLLVAVWRGPDVQP